MDAGSISRCEQDSLRVNALHALRYCRRLFYLEEVEQQYVQDEAVFAGRRLHTELEDDENDWCSLSLESSSLGLRGKVDALRTKDGCIIPYEHKRGRSMRTDGSKPEAWPSDRLQVLAYALLVENARECQVTEARVRYHGDNVLVKIIVDEEARAEVISAIAEARQLRSSVERPPVTDNQRLCVKCSLAPVCLPEEARFTKHSSREESNGNLPALRLFPPDDDRKVIHIVEQGAKIGRTGDQLKIEYKDSNSKTVKLPVNDVSQIVINGFSQISTQALRFCAEEGVGVHYVASSGQYLGCFSSARSNRVQQKIRQFKALLDPDLCLKLAKQTVLCRMDMQRQVLKRTLSRTEQGHENLGDVIKKIKVLQRLVPSVSAVEKLRGFEGGAAALYFSAFDDLLSEEVPEALRFHRRNRRPPKDRVNALLSYGYGMLLKDVIQALNVVGLEPAFGFYHQPRSSAPPLALDVMEVFRCLLVDIPVLNSINRLQWSPSEDFVETPGQVWLSDSGKRRFIEVYERRKADSWKHPIIGYSLSYARMIELEVRLLEKEWMTEGGLYARLRLR
ncbi:MAG: type I-MYXAN CRISPR-associated endonuclease Cas1 [Candidatus Obscuribacterales bacterium]|nr:type I-MYXAN CRISPR-associated endonuclease Cas1 [Candidatus Obscuribacterales bacterium]